VSPEQPVVLTGEFLRTHVADLAWEWARRGLGIGPDDPPVSEFDTDVPVELQRAVRLKLLAVLEQIRVTAETQARDTARLAAQAGADYSDLGEACGLTRQGARRRWPDLAEVTKAARRTDAAAPGAVPPFRFEIYVPDAVAGRSSGIWSPLGTPAVRPCRAPPACTSACPTRPAPMGCGSAWPTPATGRAT
jgi:hypothetical protein